MRPRRTPKPKPQIQPLEPVETDMDALQVQLKLSRAQCQYLHRQLATALQHGPMPPPGGLGELETLQAENADLRQRLGVLRLHYADEQQRSKHYKRELARLETLYRAVPRPGGLFEVPRDIEPVLRKLLALAHPDKWSQGQVATDLAHELTVAINAIRAALEA